MKKKNKKPVAKKVKAIKEKIAKGKRPIGLTEFAVMYQDMLNRTMHV